MKKILLTFVAVAFATLASHASAELPAFTSTVVSSDDVKFETKAKKGKHKAAKKAKGATR